MAHDVSDRKAPRYQCDFTGYLQVLCPELTFTPKSIHVQAQDLSETGCRMITKSITADFYKNLLREVRPVKMELDLRDGRSLILRGKLVWIDFQTKKPTTLAVSFNALEPEAQRELIKLLEDLTRTGAISVAETYRPQNSFVGDAT